MEHEKECSKVLSSRKVSPKEAILAFLGLTKKLQFQFLKSWLGNPEVQKYTGPVSPAVQMKLAKHAKTAARKQTRPSADVRPNPQQPTTPEQYDQSVGENKVMKAATKKARTTRKVRHCQPLR